MSPLYPESNRFARERGLHHAGENDSSPYRNENQQVSVHESQPPFPGIESNGPAMFDFVRLTQEAHKMRDFLLQQADVARGRSIVETNRGQADASGNLDLLLYTVPNGYEFALTRLNLEAEGFTPASPFAAAGAWIAIIVGQKFATGSILDFGPASAGGPIFPGLFTDSETQATRVRGGGLISLHVVGTATFANVDVAARIQGFIKEL